MASLFFPDFVDPLADTMFAGLGGGAPFGPSSYSTYYAPGMREGTRQRLEAGTSGAPEGTVGRPPHVVGSAGYTRSIPVDFIDRGATYLVRADVPGVHKSELHVDVHDGNVLRFGHNPNPERQVEDEEEPGIFLRAERVSSFRNRNLRMPADANLEGELVASYNDGVLEIVIPKKTEEQLEKKARNIAIE